MKDRQARGVGRGINWTPVETGNLPMKYYDPEEGETMKRLIIEPNGWPCFLEECPPGFFMFQDSLCFKSEYGDEQFCESGEMFWGGTKTKEERAKLIVQPCINKWQEHEMWG